MLSRFLFLARSQPSRSIVPSLTHLPGLQWQRPLSTAPPPTPDKPEKKERQKIVLEDKDLVEKFIKGSGPGGQAINKRVSCVELKHLPTGIMVQCQQTRSLEQNRGIARKLLKEKLDDYINGEMSKNSKRAAKIQKSKARKAKRAREKYGSKDTSVLAKDGEEKP